MTYLLKRFLKRDARPKTRDFDFDLEVEFTDKIGRIFPSVKVIGQNNGKSQEEFKKHFNLTDDSVICPETALEHASISPENLHAVATAFDIWTFCDVPNYVKESDWCPYTYLEAAYQNILARQYDHGDEQIRVPQAPGTIDTFDAEMRYFDYQYLRFIHKAGLFDSPSVNLYPEDVDRLVSCGWLTAEDFDFDLGRLMLARGVYNRVARQTDQPDVNGTKKKSPLPWSIDKTIAKPEAKHILEFVSHLEGDRFEFEQETGKPPEAFELLLFRRGQINTVWIETRRRETGLFGLKIFGISDERALELIRSTDASYVPPNEYSKKKVYGRIAPHKPIPSEKLDSRPHDEIHKTRQEFIIPDIYVTDPPYEDMEVDVVPPAFNTDDSDSEDEDEVTSTVIDANYNLRVPLKKFKRHEREWTPKELDYERPSKRRRADIDYSIPQSEPTPMGSEPVQHPLFIEGVCTSYEPEGVEQQREEQFRQREAEDPLLYLNPKSRSGQTQPWFSDLDAKIEFVEIGRGLILMVSTGRIFEYSKAERIYKEVMPLPEPILAPAPASEQELEQEPEQEPAPAPEQEQELELVLEQEPAPAPAPEQEQEQEPVPAPTTLQLRSKNPRIGPSKHAM